MRTRDFRLALFLTLAACARPTPTATPKPNVDPGRVPLPPVEVTPLPPPIRRPVLAASEAFRRGLMPLGSTNAWAFRQAHPTYDGRGVLIGILDSGIDPSVGGLQLTSAGANKVLDLRDFSGEGRIALTPVTVRGDSVRIGPVDLAGVRRVLSLVAPASLAGGILTERALGEMPASDLNGDGDNADTLAVLVGRAPDGWVLFADTNGDRSLADEKPVHDFLVARETFGWTTSGRPSPLGIAANFAPGPVPILDLVFDTSGHGTHVSGIAAGADLYGVQGFDGVAPGAQLLGLKIANNAYGGISVAGSMLAAMDYAIKFARQRQLPLVLNMSFGVGNEREGAARIDALIDSVLTANPELIFATSAGNDGPGLSTMGFPGSADRAISVGATYPPAFMGSAGTGDVVAFFSSRGGELAKPDILAPGIAYSSVPRWDTGEENKNGTSMASPHVAGALALIVSGLRQERRAWTGAQVKQAVVATGRPMAGSLAVDQGGGLLDVVAADRVLRRLPAMAVLRAAAGGRPAGALFLRGRERPEADTTIAVTLDGALGGLVRLTTSVGWLEVPATVQLTPPRTGFGIKVRRGQGMVPGVLGGVVTGWATDTTIGPLFRIPATVVTPIPLNDSATTTRATLTAAGAFRVAFPADSARPFQVRLGVTAKGQEVLSFLHEPGGQPFRDDNGRPGGQGDQAAAYDVSGRDVVAGVYEAVAVAPPSAGAAVEVVVERSPVFLRASRGPGDTVVATITGGTRAPANGTTMFGLIGAERGLTISQSVLSERRIPLTIPKWAHHLVIDLAMARESWPIFTDFGFTVVDAAGQLMGKAPLNYALGRLAIDIDSTHSGQEATLILAPAPAERMDRTWEGRLSIRFLAESPELVDPIDSADFSLTAGQTGSVRFLLPKSPWPLPSGFFPLGNLVVDVGGRLWAREGGLPDPLPPIMR